jgi:hypothetical protein
MLSQLRGSTNSGWDRFSSTYGRLIRAVARKSGLVDVEIQEVLQETTLRVFKHHSICKRFGFVDFLGEKALVKRMFER